MFKKLYVTAIVSTILVFFVLFSGEHPDNKEGVQSGTYVINTDRRRAVLGVFDDDEMPISPIEFDNFRAVNVVKRAYHPLDVDEDELVKENLFEPELDVNPPLQTGSYYDQHRNEFHFTLTGKDEFGWFGELKYGNIPSVVYVYNVASETPGYAKTSEYHLIEKTTWSEIVSEFYDQYDVISLGREISLDRNNAKWLGYSNPDDAVSVSGVPPIIRNPIPIDATDSGKRYSQSKRALKRVQSRNATTKQRYEDTDQHYATDVLRLIVMTFLVLVMVVSIFNLRTIKNLIMRDKIKRNNDFSAMFS